MIVQRDKFDFLFSLLPPFVLALLAWTLIPPDAAFEFNPDEGLNLMKAFLLAEDYDLYSEIWSDQPPLYTYLLAVWFDVLGPTVENARSLTLLFALLLIWSFYQTVRMDLERQSALLAALLLIVSHSFLYLSVSVMIVVPSLALAMLALYWFRLYLRTTAYSWLIGSGLLLGLALQVKLWVLLLIPVLLIVAVATSVRQWFNASHAVRTGLRGWLIWLVSLGMVYVVIGVLFQSLDPIQLLSPHIDAREQVVLEDFSLKEVLEYKFSKDSEVVVLALLGLVIILRHRYWQGLIPIAWLAINFIAFYSHHPVWHHHYMIFAIPLCWLAGYAFQTVTKGMSQARYGRTSREELRALVSGVLLLGVVMRIGIGLHQIVIYHDPYQQLEIVDLLDTARDETNWVFADRPIFAFRAQLPVPPSMLLSKKRMALNPAITVFLLDELKHYQPEFVVLSRWKSFFAEDPVFMTYLENHYTGVHFSQSVDAYRKISP